MQDNTQANSWCRKVSNAARFSVCGPNHEWIAYQPCCYVWTNDNTVVDRHDIIRIYKDINDLVNSAPEQVCRMCVGLEKNQTKRSPRQIAHEVIPDTAVAGKFVQLEFVFDIRCNAACVMCGPQLSTLWQQQLKMPVTMTEKSAKMHWQNIRNWIDWEPVRRVYISGGEPLLTNTADLILSSIPDLSLVELKYQTNGSVMPADSTLQHWLKAQKIILDISLDGTHEQYDYIRWPLRWTSVESNIQELVTWLETHDKHWEININYTVNPMNLLYLDRMDTWFAAMKNQYGKFEKLDYGACHHDIWGFDAVCPEIAKSFISQYGAQHPAATLLGALPDDKSKRERLSRNLEHLDSVRNLDWKKTFEKTVVFMTRHEFCQNSPE